MRHVVVYYTSMKIGESSEGPLGGTLCAVLNDLSRNVMIPNAILSQVIKESKVQKVLWPLGVHVVFTTEGMLLGLYGIDSEGVPRTGCAYREVTEENLPEDLGKDLCSLWKELKGVSDDTIEENYQKLLLKSNVKS
jgi:hypothetical protein